ncbi:MAG: hypothetical protein ACE5I5_20135, partial [Candidatus Heimdallarchaeota archaeon]
DNIDEVNPAKKYGLQIRAVEPTLNLSIPIWGGYRLEVQQILQPSCEHTEWRWIPVSFSLEVCANASSAVVQILLIRDLIPKFQAIFTHYTLTRPFLL